MTMWMYLCKNIGMQKKEEVKKEMIDVYETYFMQLIYVRSFIQLIL